MLDLKCSGIEILFLRISLYNYFIYLPLPIIYSKYPDAVFTAFVNYTNFSSSTTVDIGPNIDFVKFSVY